MYKFLSWRFNSFHINNIRTSENISDIILLVKMKREGTQRVILEKKMCDSFGVHLEAYPQNFKESYIKKPLY